MLSKEDIVAYRETGFIVIENVLNPELVHSLQLEVDQIVEQSRGVSEHTELYDLESGHSADEPRVRRLKDPDKFSKLFAGLVNQPQVIDVLNTLWDGAGVRFDKSKLNLKSAGFGSPVEWHQDWAFYPHTNDDLAAVGFMLDDITLDNGPMMVVPGSHRGEIHDHHANGIFCGGVDVIKDEVDVTTAVPLTGKAGSITIHHVRALHGSEPNRSGKARRFLLHQYCAADAWPIAVAPDYEQMTQSLLTGEQLPQPRMSDAPIRMPFPAANHQGSIYENQRELANTYFS